MKDKIKKITSFVTMVAILASSTAIFKADAATQRTQYFKYVYSTNTLSTYYLSQDEEVIMPYTTGVIGTDDRFRDGHTGIVYLKGLGTGFIVDDHVIATAAHCVCLFNNPTGDATTADFFKDYKVYMYNSSGVHNGVKLTPKEVHVPVKYKTTDSRQDFENDYALITVEENLSEYGRFSLGYAYDTSNVNSTNIPVLTTGFPQNVNGGDNSNPNTPPLMYTGYGYILAPTASENPSSKLLYYDADVTHGNSGAPVYTITEYNINNEDYILYTAISLCGVCYDTKNWGPRFDSKIMQFYLSNDNIDY